MPLPSTQGNVVNAAAQSHFNPGLHPRSVFDMMGPQQPPQGNAPSGPTQAPSNVQQLPLSQPGLPGVGNVMSAYNGMQGGGRWQHPWAHLFNPPAYGQMGLQQLGGMFQQNPDYLQQLMQLLQQGNAVVNPQQPAPQNPVQPPTTGNPVDPVIPPQPGPVLQNQNPLSPPGQKGQDIAAWQSNRLLGNAPVNPGDTPRGQYYGMFGNPSGFGGGPWNPRQGY